jgi:hypothetical protein
MSEAKKQFRRVNGHLHLLSLRTALEQHIVETVKPHHYSANDEVAAQLNSVGRHSNPTLDRTTSCLGDQFRNEQRLIDGDSKSFAISMLKLKAGRRRRVNGDYFSAGVDERASGVTSLDRCVNLNQARELL